MGRIINTVQMTADGVVDVGDWWQAATIPVHLLEARQFASGVALLRYQPLV